jgi:hypothetical protein
VHAKELVRNRKTEFRQVIENANAVWTGVHREN